MPKPTFEPNWISKPVFHHSESRQMWNQHFSAEVNRRISAQVVALNQKISEVAAKTSSSFIFVRYYQILTEAGTDIVPYTLDRSLSAMAVGDDVWLEYTDGKGDEVPFQGKVLRRRFYSAEKDRNGGPIPVFADQYLVRNAGFVGAEETGDVMFNLHDLVEQSLLSLKSE